MNAYMFGYGMMGVWHSEALKRTDAVLHIAVGRRPEAVEAFATSSGTASGLPRSRRHPDGIPRRPLGSHRSARRSRALGGSGPLGRVARRRRHAGPCGRGRRRLCLGSPRPGCRSGKSVHSRAALSFFSTIACMAFFGFAGGLQHSARVRGPRACSCPLVKRPAIQTEDHPIEYSDFEQVVPAGQCGAGTVMLWDRGTWQPENPDVDASLQKGAVEFTLHGKKIQGLWVLIRARGPGNAPRSPWLLIRHHDQCASTKDVTQEEPRSVASGRLIAGIARSEDGDIERASTDDQADTGRGAARASSTFGRIVPRMRQS